MTRTSPNRRKLPIQYPPRVALAVFAKRLQVLLSIAIVNFGLLFLVLANRHGEVWASVLGLYLLVTVALWAVATWVMEPGDRARVFINHAMVASAGIGLGLMFGWLIFPAIQVGSTIADLAEDQKEEYIILVAEAYTANQDLDNAQARLARLNLPDVNQALESLIYRYVVEGKDESDIYSLVYLARDMGVDYRQVVTYLITMTPYHTYTPPPTGTPIPPTGTSIPPTRTPAPPTSTPKPQPARTASTARPAAIWTIVEQRLVGPGEDAQTCEGGTRQIRATVIDANGAQIPNIWIHDYYSGDNRVTGHKDDDPYWGPGEAQFDYYGYGGGMLCITTGEGGPCESPSTRSMPCWDAPPIDDLYAAGYCECCEAGATKERCQQLMNEGKCLGPGHYSWRVVFRRSG